MLETITNNPEDAQTPQEADKWDLEEKAGNQSAEMTVEELNAKYGENGWGIAIPDSHDQSTPENTQADDLDGTEFDEAKWNIVPWDAPLDENEEGAGNQSAEMTVEELNAKYGENGWGIAVPDSHDQSAPENTQADGSEVIEIGGTKWTVRPWDAPLE